MLICCRTISLITFLLLFLCVPVPDRSTRDPSLRRHASARFSAADRLGRWEIIPCARRTMLTLRGCRALRCIRPSFCLIYSRK